MLEQLKEKIIKANPSILELTEGCKVNLTIDWTFVGKNYAGNSIFYTEFGSQTKTFTKKEFKLMTIIGHPIELKHILIALSKTLKDGDVINLHLNMYGQLVFNEKIIDWNLAENLDGQSKETLDYLEKLIN